jgi:hypothetical protein
METVKAKEPPPCAPWEAWLVSVASNQAKRVQLLVAGCSSGAGAPVLADLGPNQIRYTVEQDGGASDEYDIGLEPPHIESETHRGQGDAISWNYGNYGGQECDREECVPVMLEASVKDDAFARDGWKTTGLGQCAMLVDGVTGDGSSHGQWVAHGATSSVRLLLSRGTLYVEVTDDAFVTKGSVVDTLVFYSTSPQAMPGYRSETARLRMDGQLTDWQGKVRQVEVATGPSIRRFALTDVWPGPEGPWRLSYEDTDDGRTFGPGQSTGKFSHEPWVFTSPLACVPRDGELRLDRSVVPDAERPLVP